jgi:hypothetical protein
MPKTTATKPRSSENVKPKRPPACRQRQGSDQAIVTLTDTRTRK